MKAGLRNFIRFVALGGCAAMVNYGIRFVLSTFMRFEAAVAVAYVIAMFVGVRGGVKVGHWSGGDMRLRAA